MVIGRRIKRARELAGMSREQLAAAVGVSMKTVANWETDRTEPQNKMAVLEQVLKADLSIDSERDALPRPVGLTNKIRQLMTMNYDELLAEWSRPALRCLEVEQVYARRRGLSSGREAHDELSEALTTLVDGAKTATFKPMPWDREVVKLHGNVTDVAESEQGEGTAAGGRAGQSGAPITKDLTVTPLTDLLREILKLERIPGVTAQDMAATVRRFVEEFGPIESGADGGSFTFGEVGQSGQAGPRALER